MDPDAKRFAAIVWQEAAKPYRDTIEKLERQLAEAKAEIECEEKRFNDADDLIHKQAQQVQILREALERIAEYRAGMGVDMTMVRIVREALQRSGGSDAVQ